MSLTASNIDAMLQAGCTAEQIAIVVKADIAERELIAAGKRAKDAARQQAKRAREAGNSHAMSRDVTACPRDIADPFPDKERSPKPPKEINPIQNPPLSPRWRDDWVPQAEWAAFEDMRRRIRKPMTDRARELAVSKLAELRDEGHDPAEVLNQSVMNSYQGLFPLKTKGGGGPQHHGMELPIC
jgi:hypothetical protein